MSEWRDLSTRFPEHTLVRDPAAYADVFAAIDEAVERAATVEPRPDECEVLYTVTKRNEDGEEEEVPALLWRVPIVPVRVPSTVRLCIGLLQYYHWPVARSNEGGCLPHVPTLLKRKLRPTLDEGVDLAAFLVTRTNRADREDYMEPSAPILNLIERNFPPPVPAPLATVLHEAMRRIGVVRENYVESLKPWRGKSQTKRFDKWTARLNRLIGDSAIV